MARNYSSTAGVKTLASDITSSSATQLTLTEATDDLPSPPFMLVLNPDTAKEEIVLVDANQTGVSEPTYKITRGQDDTTPTTHTAGDTVKHMIVGSDLQLPHNHIDATAAHGATGAVVGTTNTQTLTNKTVNLTSNTLTGTKAQFNTAMSDADFATIAGTETLTNKTLTSPKINEDVVVTATATELNYVDGVTSAIQTQLNTNTPVGSILMWATATAPTGWLICDGQSTAGYAALAAVVGATVPDLRGRAPIGAGLGTGLTDRTLGATLGAESVTLTALESGIRAHSHANTVSISGDGAHTHNIKTRKVTTSDHDHDNTDANVGPSTAAGSGAFAGTTQSGAALSAGHSHSVSISNASHTATAATDAHQNMQPSLVVNFIIKH
jgi:microcystin-dependent protein